jgi:hypothetical protein
MREAVGEVAKMGMQEEALCAPDTYGLKEYFVTDIITEVIGGGNVRLVCGARHAGHVQWRYTVVLPAEQLMHIGLQCQQAAEKSLLLQQMIRRSH